MSEQDRINANEYHYSIYKKICNVKDIEKAQAIALEQMKIIDEDRNIENGKEDKKIELVYDHQSRN